MIAAYKKLPVITMAVIALGQAHASVVYTSTPSPVSVGLLASSNTTTYGQVFTAPSGSDTQLDSFGLYINGTLTSAYGGVATWTGTGAGTSLFTSAVFPAVYATLTEVTINTGGVALTPGQQYVAYFSVSGIFGNSGEDFMSLGLGSALGGGFAYDNANGGSPLHNNWSCQGACGYGSAAYHMTFNAPGHVPEPISLALVGLGLVGIAATRRKGA